MCHGILHLWSTSAFIKHIDPHGGVAVSQQSWWIKEGLLETSDDKSSTGHTGKIVQSSGEAAFESKPSESFSHRQLSTGIKNTAGSCKGESEQNVKRTEAMTYIPPWEVQPLLIRVGVSSILNHSSYRKYTKMPPAGPWLDLEWSHTPVLLNINEFATWAVGRHWRIGNSKLGLVPVGSLAPGLQKHMGQGSVLPGRIFGVAIWWSQWPFISLERLKLLALSSLLLFLNVLSLLLRLSLCRACWTFQVLLSCICESCPSSCVWRKLSPREIVCWAPEHEIKSVKMFSCLCEVNIALDSRVPGSSEYATTPWYYHASFHSCSNRKKSCWGLWKHSRLSLMGGIIQRWCGWR